MKIVHIITALPADGAEMLLYRLIRASRGTGVQHTVISLSSEDTLAARIREAGADVRILGMRRGVPGPRKFATLIRWLDELDPDVVQTWLYHGDLMGGLAVHAASAWRRMRGLRAPRPALVWGIHHTDLRSTGSNRMTRWVTRACALLSARVPDSIICCGEAARRSHAHGGYYANKMMVIPNGFEADVFKPMPHARETLRRALGFDADAPVIGIVGRYHPVKDYPNFIAAMRRVLQGLPHCRFVMAGRGLDESNGELVAWLREAGVEHACRLLGALRDPQTTLAALDVFCLSSRSEGLPTVVGEAMACGVPCVATDVGDTKWLIGETGFVVPPQDADALADALVAMLTLSEETRAALGKAARERIDRQFSIDTTWRRYEETYRGIRTMPRGPRAERLNA
ncbi:glycosyltransferase [Caballeronia sp. AZ10_KS36]|uniref:glycosyltransferase n=1 Tax=Caballeronia sp. AZ10_KS36 TaxID=2921757 RepID=UPI0020288464